MSTCCFVSLCHSSTQENVRCGKRGIEFTIDAKGRKWWYCAPHWDAKLEMFGDAGLLVKGRPWFDRTLEQLHGVEST